MLLGLGFRVVVPDMIGYGRTDAPPYTTKAYGYKQVSDDMKELADQLDEPHIVVLGHDWYVSQYYSRPLICSHVL